MYGAILGDIIGSPYEFDQGNKTKDFPLFTDQSHYTDDTVMTIAIADALLCVGQYDIGNADDVDKIEKMVIEKMRLWGQKYPHAGYGWMFSQWLQTENPKPYGSYGNGSAMRVSSVGWLYDSLNQTRVTADLTAKVTHDHPEGRMGADCVASVIYMARSGNSKRDIRDWVQGHYYGKLKTCDEIRPEYYHQESCQHTVPEAVSAFLEGEDFEDVIRNAVSLGGDCDTLTCIAGAIAEAYFGVPEQLKEECLNRIEDDMLEVLLKFDKKRL